MRRDLVAHERLMIRGYILAMAFVWVRVMYDRQNEMFPFIRNIDVRDTTREWLSFVVPVIVAETWLGWWPALRRARRLPGVRHLQDHGCVESGGGVTTPLVALTRRQWDAATCKARGEATMKQDGLAHCLAAASVLAGGRGPRGHASPGSR